MNNKKRKRKLDPKIIRVGDVVEINNPEFFVRCGYPLCLKDMIDEIYKNHTKEINAFCDKISGKKISVPTKFNFDFDFLNKPRIEHADMVRYLAYIRLQNKGFGGNERKIFTEKIDEHKNKRANVIGVKIVKTGKRYVDDDGVFLDNPKTHKILSLHLIHSEPPKLISCNSYDLMMEAIHVSKIYDKSQVESACGMIGILDEMRICKKEWMEHTKNENISNK